MGAVVRILDFRRLMAHAPELCEQVHREGIEFVLFSTNDQVFDRISIGPLVRQLRVGYSSFSGIDYQCPMTETLVCLSDLLSDSVTRLNSRSCLESTKSGWTVSLLFDTEQMGCVRFGLPRVTEALAEFSAPSTFFMTNFVEKAYPGTAEALLSAGHEIGIHGEYHEYLSGRNFSEQCARLHRMRNSLSGAGLVAGANFIGRMDDTTIRAFARSGFSYYVEFMEHRFAPFRYREMPTHPMRVWTRYGEVWRIPISVESNNRPESTVRNVLHSAVRHAARSGSGHVNILLHPFREGASRHEHKLRSLLRYLRDELGCSAIRLQEFVASLPRRDFQCAIHYETGCSRPPVAGRRWWTDRNYYQRRIGTLYEALLSHGREPGLALDPIPGTPTFSIFPALAKESGKLRRTACDPLAREALERTLRSSDLGRHSDCHFVPNGRSSDLINRLRDTAPRDLTELARTFPEVGARLVFKLTPGRHVF